MLGLNKEQLEKLDRALRFPHRIYTNGWNATRTIKALVDGIKPVACLYDTKEIRQLIEENGLSAINYQEEDFIIFKEENRDIAELLFDIYLHRSSHYSCVFYFVFGACLGYPIDRIVFFSIKNTANLDDIHAEVSEVAHRYLLETQMRLTRAA